MTDSTAITPAEAAAAEADRVIETEAAAAYTAATEALRAGYEAALAEVENTTQARHDQALATYQAAVQDINRQHGELLAAAGADMRALRAQVIGEYQAATGHAPGPELI